MEQLLGRLSLQILLAKILERYQMRHKSLPFFVILLLLSPFILVEAKDWHEIRPLHSTRGDVERLLGPSKTATQLSTYQTAEEAISVLYSSGPPCGSDAGSEWS